VRPAALPHVQDGGDGWMRDTWGDGCDDVLGSFGLAGPSPAGGACAPAAGASSPISACASLDDDDDAMLLPMDFSAMDAMDAFAFT
jgi:hypothetical protein